MSNQLGTPSAQAAGIARGNDTLKAAIDRIQVVQERCENILVLLYGQRDRPSQPVSPSGLTVEHPNTDRLIQSLHSNIDVLEKLILEIQNGR